MSQALDISLESSFGGTRNLRDYRGRIMVLFWEDRNHRTQNEGFKAELTARIEREGWHDRVALVAVGDVHAYDFEPARSIVRAAISAIAKSGGIEILFDWKSALSRAPLHFEPEASNIAVLDATGELLWKRSGALGRRERDSIFHILEAMLAAREAA